jgi:hypothetical protein
MECDIILEGFQEAEAKHGLRYLRIIGDGDSSVYATIQQQVPIWGTAVQKLECANHAVKCLRSSLEKLVVEKPQYKGKNLLTKVARVRLTTAVRCAIKMRSTEANREEAIPKLRKDITNAVHHVFGTHTNCSPDFCKVKNGELVQQSITSDQSMASESASDNHDHPEEGEPMCEALSHWLEGTKEHEMEEARGPSPVGIVRIQGDMLKDISILLTRLSDKAPRLIGNFTTNLAESWMNVRMKLDGGKVINRCGRGSWHARCYGGALRMNFGQEWSPQVWEQCTGIPAGKFFKQHYARLKQMRANSAISRKKPDVKARARKRKSNFLTSSHTKKAKRAYGPDALDVTADLPEVELKAAIAKYTGQHFQLSNAEIKTMEYDTREQSSSGLWRTEHKKHLTSSVFGEIVKRRKTTRCALLVKRIIYPSFKGNTFTRHGLASEAVTIKEYELKKAEEGHHVTVQNTGLVIDPTHQCLAASPDGVVTNHTLKSTGMIEIKNLLKDKPLTLLEGTKCVKDFCLESTPSGLRLKPTHKYYYQCQGLLNIAHKDGLDFVVRSERPYQIHIESIRRDKVLWEKILPKLLGFHSQCMLPELAAPRCNLCPGIREPKESWVSYKNNMIAIFFVLI